ncbi:MAG: hypothetical protein KF858_16480 [Candidatus Sumerlaeia bacterium]|nr:hypothetical protein [Candidatus Sumerlaeia bacterium]
MFRLPVPRRVSLLMATLALVAVATVACRSKSPDYARIDDAAIRAATAPVNILNRDLRSKVAADIASAERLPDGRLNVRVNLRNSTTKPLNVEARTVFKDIHGLGTGDSTEWKALYFAPQQIQTFGTTSRDETAQRFTVEVRKP